jgi:hypothetical protein
VKKLLGNIALFVKKYSLPLTLLIVLTNILIASWTILHGDLHFNADIARDFLLLQELSQKGIILIGPRASGLPGLFHGPLWVYLNYPAYVIGHGNPIVVGYFWILLNLLFLGISYFVASKLFNRAVAYVYIILLSGATVYYVDNLFNPFGAMFVLPIFLFTIVKYVQTFQWRYLVGALLALGCIIQFQMAIGLPFLILTVLYIFYTIFKHKKYSHLSAFALMILPFSTFILFDLRHDFQQTRAIINAFLGNSGIFVTPYLSRLENRWESMTHNLYFAQGDHSSLVNGIVSLFLIFFLFDQLVRKRDKEDKHKIIYFTIAYFYIGFYILSVFFNGILLYHYTFPLIPLLFLVLSSMILYLNKKVFFSLLVVVILTNLSGGLAYEKANMQAKGVAQTSWVFQFNIAQKILTSSDNNFGYLIFTPDFYAYGPKYAYTYAKSLHPEKTVYLFQKKPITYAVIEPAPADRQDLNSTYWETSLVKLTSGPIQEETFSNGFKIKKYKLTQKEIDIPVDPQTADWLHFR